MALHRLVMTDNELMDVWVGATRYFLGRMTASVTSYCETLESLWHKLPPSVQHIIQRDVEEAFLRDDAQRARYAGKASASGTLVLALGHDCDRSAWERVRLLWQPQKVSEEVSA